MSIDCSTIAATISSTQWQVSLHVNLSRQMAPQGGAANDEPLGFLHCCQGIIHRVLLQVEGLHTNASLGDASADGLSHACCVAVRTGIQHRYLALFGILNLVCCPLSAV